MDPSYLLIENFMSHLRTEIDFNQFSCALIMGQFKNNPQESNGVGKTVILHAIEYALFGTYPTRTVDRIVRDGTKTARVTFDFVLNQETYRVIRQRTVEKSTDVSLQILKGGKWEDISQRTPTETHKALQGLLKINVSSFKNSVQFSQNNLDGLLASRGKEATSDERTAILKDAVNLTVYKHYEKAAKEKLSETNKLIEVSKALIASLGNPEVDLQQFESQKEEITKLISDKSQRLKEIDAAIDARKSELGDLQHFTSSEVSQIHEKIHEVKKAKDQISYDIKSLRDKVITNENKIASLNAALEKKKEVLLGLQQRSTDIRSKRFRPIDKVRSELESTSQNEINGKGYIASLEKKAEELKKPLPDGHECPTCRQSLTNQYKKACQETIQKELEELLEEIADKKPKLKRCTTKKNRLQKELDEINKAMNYISSLDSQIDTKKQEISNDQNYIAQLQGLSQTHKSDLALQEQRLSEAEERKKRLQESLNESSKPEIESQITALQEKIAELKKVRYDLNIEINSESSKLGEFKAKIEECYQRIEKLSQENNKLAQLEYQQGLYKKIRKAFSSGGIPTMIIHTILDDLQTEANNFLSELKPGLEVQFTPEVDLLYKYHGRDREFGQLSGGQKFIIALSLKLGLSVIIQRRLGVEIKLLQLDEVDKPLDGAAVDAYAEAIRKLQKRFKILVITHDDHLKDKFNNIIMVNGDEIRGATSRLISH